MSQLGAQFVRSILWWRGVFAGFFTVRFPLPLPRIAAQLREHQLFSHDKRNGQ